MSKSTVPKQSLNFHSIQYQSNQKLARRSNKLTCKRILVRSRGATEVLANAPAAPPAISSLTYTGKESTKETFAEEASSNPVIFVDNVDPWEETILIDIPTQAIWEKLCNQYFVDMRKIIFYLFYPLCSLKNSLSHLSLAIQNEYAFCSNERFNGQRTPRINLGKFTSRFLSPTITRYIHFRNKTEWRSYNQTFSMIIIPPRIKTKTHLNSICYWQSKSEKSQQYNPKTTVLRNTVRTDLTLITTKQQPEILQRKTKIWDQKSTRKRELQSEIAKRPGEEIA